MNRIRTTMLTVERILNMYSLRSITSYSSIAITILTWLVGKKEEYLHINLVLYKHQVNGRLRKFTC